MEIKLFEIRDVGTFIPVMAMVMESDNEAERYLLSRCGWCVEGNPFVVMTRLDGSGILLKTPDEWSQVSRTMRTAHEYIATNWSKLTTGDVVCVETILGERETPKISERLEEP